MKVQVYPKLVLRTPKFSYLATLHDCWDELKEAISISSNAFYQTIKDVEVKDLDSLQPKVLFTIWKYFNRSKFRATPYGTFASFSTVNNASLDNNEPIVLKNDFKLHEFTDWPVKNDLDLEFKRIVETDGVLQSNSSWYKILNAIRYIACSEGQFELAEIDQDEFVERILIACSGNISVGELVKTLNLQDEELESFYALLEDIHSIQLLFCDLDPNIVGEDYFERLNLQSSLTHKPKYIIAERDVLSGNFNMNYNKDLVQLIQKLHQISPKIEQKSLTGFITKFRTKFEQKEVALLQVLDPEIGIGYDNLEQGGTGNDFIGELLHKDHKTKRKTVKDLLKPLFFNRDLKNRDTVFLNNLNTADEQRDLLKLPNSFSALFSVADDLIILEQVGGYTANTLNGRFTMAGTEVFDFCRDIAKIEAKANPDVLFFEVAYMVENTIDNVNRRKLLYDYQLSILNFNTSKELIALDDIMLSVVNNEVILRSKKYNKRLIPKIASAYNYNRSDLSIFRLFCDLQHQNIQSNLLFSLSDIYPDQNCYPRFQYNKIILSLAKWKVFRKDLFSDFDKQSEVENCRLFLNNLGLPRYFKTGNADQTLTFDLENDVDVQAFIFYMQKKEDTWLEEVLLPVKSNVIDDDSKPFLAQFVSNFYQEEEVYKGFNIVEDASQFKEVKQVFAPGSEWLYFEVYCHQQRSDYLLCTLISDFVNNHSDKIKNWFFIRYNENGDHLRFRLLLNDERDGYTLISEFSKAINWAINEGIVSELLVKTYKREIERYSSELIEEAELVFSASSKLVIAFLQYGFDAEAKYKSCLLLVKKIMESNVFSFNDLKYLVKSISDSFNAEHNLEADEFKKLNAQYQIFKGIEEPVFENELSVLFDAFAKQFINLLIRCAPNKRMKLFGDLTHMHLNRLFNKDQRAHEMIMYYFMLKDIQRLNALSKIDK